MDEKERAVFELASTPFTYKLSTVLLYTNATWLQPVEVNGAEMVERTLLLATPASIVEALMRTASPLLLPPKLRIIVLFVTNVGFTQRAIVLFAYPSLGNPPAAL